VDIRVRLPDGTELRERRRAPTSSRSAARRWGEARAHQLLLDGLRKKRKEVSTLSEFWSRFRDGHMVANRLKPSGIAAKETIAKRHLIPVFGPKKLDAITTEKVQGLMSRLSDRAPKTVNNVLTVLNVVLKKAVEWGELERMPCTIRLLPIPKPSAQFHDFDEYERLLTAAEALGSTTYVLALLFGDAGLRCGEAMALQHEDVDHEKRQLCVQRSDWKGHVTIPKGGHLRYVPMTLRLAGALRKHRHLRGKRVLCQGDGSPLTQKIVQDHLRRAARKANVREGVHILRHTFCSHLAMRGAPARAIQELAGHQDLSTTQRYMHLSPAAIESAIRLLDTKSASGFGDIVETEDQRSAKASG